MTDATTPGQRRNAVDILGIGVQKSATSWAAHVLNLHPNVWFPRQHALSGKEVSFFDGPKWRNGIDWYRRIMTPPDPAFLSADVSPGYSRVGDGKVRSCHKIAPDARVFYIMRNPIHRDWSGMQMQAKRRSFDLGQASFVDLMVFYDAERISQFSTYVETIPRWRKLYPDLFLGLYDDVAADPLGFYRALCAHVGLDPEAVPDWERRVTAKIFQGPGVPMPEPMFEFLSKKYRGLIETLGPLIGRDLAHWLEPLPEQTPGPVLEGADGR